MNPFTTHGAFSWPELHTTHPDSAAAYYAAIFSWETTTMDMPDGPYVVGMVNGSGIAGIMRRPMEQFPVQWHLYVTVDDVDDACLTAVEAGGKVVWPGEDVPGVGRIAHIQDPQGAVVGVVAYETKDSGGPAMDAEEAFGVPGRFSWFELRVPDINAVMDFYSALFGWDIAIDTMHTGPYGVVKIDGTGFGGMMSVSPEEMPPHWGLYVTVEDVDAWTTVVESAGGTILFPAVNVPDVGRFTMAKDPQGGVLAGMEYDA